jgi:serine/threonine protein phosphatase PrpC
MRGRMNVSVPTAVAFATDRGLIRDRNEDRVLGVTWHEPDDAAEDIIFLAVADGMGGMAGGDVASSIAIEAAGETMRERLESHALTGQTEWFAAFADTFANAVTRLQQRVVQAPDLVRMGTTLTCVAVHRGRIILAHVGDSRAYLFRSHVLRRLTTDHNAAAELVSEGRLTPSEADTHRSRYVLTRWLGADASALAEPEFGALAAEPGDLLLVCSDGLHGMLSDDQITAMLESASLSVDGDLTAAASTLIADANEHGGRDNISVALGVWGRS